MANTKVPARLLDTSAIPALNVTGDLTVDTTTLKVDSTNNRVGIGIASPLFPLHINSSITDVAKFQTSGSYTYTRFQNSSKTWALSIGSDFGFYDEAASATRMIIDSSGNVGIGTSGPAQKLHVSGNAYIAAGNYFTDSTSGYFFGGSGSFTNGVYGVGVNNMAFNVNGSERMRITSNGGIEAATTEAKCLQLNSTHSNGPYLSFQESGSSKFYIGKRSAVGGTDGTGYDLYAAGNYDIAFYTNAARRWSINTSGHFTPNNQHAYDIGGTNAEVRNIYAQGISFASNANESGMTSELLDDYEEGTFTATIGSNGTGPTITQGNTIACTYTKIGNVCTVHGYSGVRNITAVGTGSPLISGLPFTATNYAQPVLGHCNMFPDSVSGYVEVNQSYFFPIKVGTTAHDAYTTGAKYIMFSMTYRVN